MRMKKPRITAGLEKRGARTLESVFPIKCAPELSSVRNVKTSGRMLDRFDLALLKFDGDHALEQVDEDTESAP
jgi:hypothetical protein